MGVSVPQTAHGARVFLGLVKRGPFCQFR
jgi:hypothetical protein